MARTSSATKSLYVCTVAPRPSATLISRAYDSVSGVHISGNRANVRSWIVSKTGAAAGGATNAVACTTSTGPVHRSIAGVATRGHRIRVARAGKGRVAHRTPGGASRSSSSRPRHVIA